ncbi:MAG: ion transporter [Candidatus Fimenecus sp.]
MKKIKRRTFEIIQAANNHDVPSRIFDIGILILIIINVILVIAETFDISPTTEKVFYYIETVSVIIFTIEYLCRVWTADLLYPNLNGFRSRLKYIFSFIALIDLFAILPFYIPFIIPVDLRVLRMLRIIRLFRIFKLNRYTTALTTIAEVFRKKKNQLISSIFVVLLLMIVASVLMYNIESKAQPEVFDNAFSALWWSVATLTTVGYGDIYPITAMGKVLSAIIALLGIGLVAVPTGIISSGFMETIDHQEDDEKEYCPYCGKKLK